MSDSEYPQELIDAIIEEVPHSARTTLAACALTSSAFVASSQRRLFWGVSIANVGAYKRAAALLASSPHLGAYVRCLELNIAGLPKDCPQLKEILSRLPDVERLVITGRPVAFHDQLGENPSLLDLIARSSVKALGLRNVSRIHPSVVLRAFSYMEQVSLYDVSIANADGNLGDVAPSAKVHHLRITGDEYSLVIPFISQPTLFTYLRHLTSISVLFPPIYDELKPGFNSLLTACSSTLKHLKLELEAPYDNLPALPGLSHLELWLDVDLLKTPVQLAAIVSRTAAATPHIHALTLAMMDRPKQAPQRQLAFPFSVAEWPALDDAIMGLRDLREVEFSLRYF
ncbi:hypothetical protein B0H15DRAFT_817525, partial [Mycena belliarum]